VHAAELIQKLLYFKLFIDK